MTTREMIQEEVARIRRLDPHERRIAHARVIAVRERVFVDAATVAAASPHATRRKAPRRPSQI